MPIFWREGLRGRWAVLVYSDPYTKDELSGALTQILAHPVGEPCVRILVDRRHCQAPSLSFVNHIAGFDHAHAERFTDGYVAMVTSDDVGFGAARMTEMMIEARGVPCTMRTFRDWDEAERWLSDPSPDL